MSKAMEEALSVQLNHEFASGYLYLSMAAYLSAAHLPGAARWMRLQAQEEVGHAMKLYDFVDNRGASMTLRGLDDPPARWQSLLAVFEAALAHERVMTERLNDLIDLAMAERDHASHNLLQWFIDEQVEEEATLDTIVRRLALIGSDGSGLFLIDTELGKRGDLSAPQA